MTTSRSMAVKTTYVTPTCEDSRSTSDGCDARTKTSSLRETKRNDE